MLRKLLECGNSRRPRRDTQTSHEARALPDGAMFAMFEPFPEIEDGGHEKRLLCDCEDCEPAAGRAQRRRRTGGNDDRSEATSSVAGSSATSSREDSVGGAPAAANAPQKPPESDEKAIKPDEQSAAESDATASAPAPADTVASDAESKVRATG